MIVQENEQEADLRRQLRDMQVELKTINMVDEFARYAKLERKINRLKEELSKFSECLMCTAHSVACAQVGFESAQNALMIHMDLNRHLCNLCCQCH